MYKNKKCGSSNPQMDTLVKGSENGTNIIVDLKPSIIDLHNQRASVKRIAKTLRVNKKMVSKTISSIGKQPCIPTQQIIVQSEVQQESILTTPSCFTVMKANDFVEKASMMKRPRNLFDCLVVEKEITILFAPTNVGKSILSVQIADSISRGESINGFATELTQPMRVFYADFELSDYQFGSRYFDDLNRKYHFSDTLFRAVQNRDVSTDEMINNLRKAMIETKSEVLVFDNISFLSNRLQNAEEALNTLKALRNLRDELKITMVIVAHTNKKDNKPLSINDLAGSAKIGNLIDAAFAIGSVPRDKGLRYIKQLKCRNGEKKYEDPVIIAEVDKDIALYFKFRGTENEAKLLKAASSVSEDELKDRIWELSQQGMSSRQIESELGVSKSKVCTIIKRMKEELDKEVNSTNVDK